MTDAAESLRRYAERVESLMAECDDIRADIREIYAEVKANGFDIKVFRQLIARRRMDATAREEADALLATYEAAMGMRPDDGDALEPLTSRRPDAAAIALELLTAELVTLEDPAQATVLVEHVMALLDIRAEIAVLRQQESARKKLARDEGFEPKQFAVTVRWFEKVAKHGEEAMRAGEATFHLYRGTVEGHHARGSMETERDKALFAKFAGDGAAKPQASKRQAQIDEIRALHRAQRDGNRGSIL